MWRTRTSILKSWEYMQKVQLTQDFKKLNVEQLGIVVDIIKNHSPKAYKDIDNENCNILVDYINSSTLTLLYQ